MVEMSVQQQIIQVAFSILISDISAMEIQLLPATGGASSLVVGTTREVPSLVAGYLENYQELWRLNRVSGELPRTTKTAAADYWGR